MTVGTFQCPSCRRNLTHEQYEPGREMCRQCARDADQLAASGVSQGRPAVQAPANGRIHTGALLTLIGGLFMLTGLHFLLIAPGQPAGDTGNGYGLPREVVNIQRITIGETFTIVGGVFLAAAWRPRTVRYLTSRVLSAGVPGRARHR